MNVHIPDCYSVDDLLVFGDISHGVICQGIDVSIPDQSNVEAEVLNALESDLRTFLANLQEGKRLQVSSTKTRITIGSWIVFRRSRKKAICVGSAVVTGRSAISVMPSAWQKVG